jgi:hypothetical protein
MPGYDGTGPEGQGPMTGGARGLCNPRNVSYRRFYRGFGSFRRFFGHRRPQRGLGLGRRGRGRGRW